jgi:site-specific DNA-methyltransferase (adenine-specific)
MKLELLKLDQLTPDPTNARAHDEKNLSAIEGSLREFGQRKPIVIDQRGVIVAGNGTVEAAKRLGWTDIEAVRVPTDWDSDRIKAFALADNRTAELATWNQEVMASQLLELQEAGFEIQEFGFELAEPIKEPDPIEEDALPDDVAPRTKLGDIWQLGSHRLICGDSFDRSTVDRILQGEKVSMVFTDPPYGMDLDTDYSGMGATKTTYKKIANDDKPFDLDAIWNLVKSPVWYVWGADYFPKTIQKWDAGSIIVWAKAHSEDENKVFGSSFEICWRYPKAKKEVWFVRRIQMTNELLKAHPTQKPLALPIRAMEKDTKKDDLVFDFFLGSGTTLIAAEQLDRRCYGIELDPKYCDVIIQRWENLTGQKAELINDGR